MINSSSSSIGILYIATGRYHIFWEDFYRSSEKHFMPGVAKKYFLFSDYQGSFLGEETGSVYRIYQKKLGWPYDTLMRFDIFLKEENLFKDVDYLFFINANVIFINDIYQNEILIPEKDLIAALQPWFIGLDIDKTTYDRNPQSTAYIPYGEGEHYVMGSFNGGKTAAFLEMCRQLNNNIHLDLKKDIIALWHDESHLNHYFWKNKEKIFILPSSYLLDEWQQYFPSKKTHYIKPSYLRNNDVRLIMRNKNHYRYGGKDYMRGIVDKKIEFNWSTFLFDLKIYRRYLKERTKAIFKGLFKI
ncbi:glycosyl transferase [Pasteurella canis]|uniref:glycosyl transferase n=1 Tax=Pasteurella canis TaxID=753 RepID=UPI001CC7492E|nr:glycosyl transferase [Pasteurella canis]UAY78607.1 glycosyl transferase [Pasteurella canis]